MTTKRSVVRPGSDRWPRTLRASCAPPLIAVVLAALLAGCGGSSGIHVAGSTLSPASGQSAGRVATADSFLTVDQAAGGGGYTLQLRSVSGRGAVVRSLLHTGSGTTVSAAEAADGSVVVALTTGCATTWERIESSTGRALRLGTVDETASGVVLAPDGTRVAYLTQLRCAVNRCPDRCAGHAAFLPSVLVVSDPVTGHDTRTATDDPGHPLFGLSWSPDGRQIVAGYMGDRQQLLVFDAEHLSFPAAHRVPNPPACSYFSPTWTVAGLVAARGCGSEPFLSPATMVQINAAGVASAAWALPDCINGFTTSTDPAHARILIQTTIGYGNGRCGKRSATDIAGVADGHLRTVVHLPTSSVTRLEG